MASPDSSAPSVAISRTALFQGIRPSQLETLAAASRHKRHKKGSTVVEEGDPGYSLYVILKGRVGIRTTDETGEYIFVAERGKDEVFGEMSLFDGKPRSNDVIALEDCEFLIIERSEFLRAITANAEIALRMMATLSDRIREVGNLLGRQMSVRKRLCAFLLEELERAHQEAGQQNQFRLNCTRQEIAERIRSRRETVSRELGMLVADKILRVQGREIAVLSNDRLQRLAR